MEKGVWQKSSFSGEGANCLFVAADERSGGVSLVESEAPDTVLRATPQGLRHLICQVKTGRFGVSAECVRVM
ncbi:DUF397 domain-containing protein [Streptomyces sp. NPDC017056]|uniref:DUF397 domain-containing protein n=1 Tax=Streptomyces sp. NPDC017056 TaxID=3364973 RepID=UPI00378E9172